MQRDTDILNLKILENKTLRSGKPCYVALLGPVYAGQVLALHNKVIDSLPETEKSFMLPKDLDYFHAHMQQNNRGDAVLGILNEDGELLAKSVIHQTSDASILQAVTVHPDCKGNGLMQAMVKQWLSHAASYGHTATMAEMETRNMDSLIAFMKAGFIVGAAGRDRSKPDELNSIGELRTKYAVFKNLSPVFNEAAGSGSIIACAIPNVADQKMLLGDGYCGTGINVRSGAMTFEQKACPAFLKGFYL